MDTSGFESEEILRRFSHKGEFFHDSPIELEKGERVVPRLRSDTANHDDETYYLESEFEQVRLDEYPDKPSRLTSTYLHQRDELGRFLYPYLREHTERVRYVMSVPEGAKIHYTDVNFWSEAKGKIIEGYSEIYTLLVEDPSGIRCYEPEVCDETFIALFETTDYYREMLAIIRAYWEGVDPDKATEILVDVANVARFKERLDLGD